MFDVNLVLQEAEELLADHYTVYQQRGTSRVQVFHTPETRAVPVKVASSQPPAPPVTRTSAPATPAQPTGLSDLVANIFVLLLLGVLNNKLTKGGARSTR